MTEKTHSHAIRFFYSNDGLGTTPGQRMACLLGIYIQVLNTAKCTPVCLPKDTPAFNGKQQELPYF